MQLLPFGTLSSLVKMRSECSSASPLCGRIRFFVEKVVQSGIPLRSGEIDKRLPSQNTYFFFRFWHKLVFRCGVVKVDFVSFVKRESFSCFFRWISASRGRNRLIWADFPGQVGVSFESGEAQCIIPCKTQCFCTIFDANLNSAAERRRWYRQNLVKHSCFFRYSVDCGVSGVEKRSPSGLHGVRIAILLESGEGHTRCLS